MKIGTTEENPSKKNAIILIACGRYNTLALSVICDSKKKVSIG